MIVATFKVHLSWTEVVPSWTAWKQWQSGELVVHDDHAEFESRTNGRVLISGVTSVGQSRRRQSPFPHDISWMVNTWIAVHYTIPGQRRVVYFNDARFFGFGHYLPHRRMRQCLEALVGPSTAP